MSEYEIQPFFRDGTFHYDVVEIRNGKHPRWMGTYGSELGAERGIDLLRQQNASQWRDIPETECVECERIKREKKAP